MIEVELKWGWLNVESPHDGYREVGGRLVAVTGSDPSCAIHDSEGGHSWPADQSWKLLEEMEWTTSRCAHCMGTVQIWDTGIVLPRLISVSDKL